MMEIGIIEDRDDQREVRQIEGKTIFAVLKAL